MWLSLDGLKFFRTFLDCWQFWFVRLFQQIELLRPPCVSLQEIDFLYQTFCFCWGRSSRQVLMPLIDVTIHRWYVCLSVKIRESDPLWSYDFVVGCLANVLNWQVEFLINYVLIRTIQRIFRDYVFLLIKIEEFSPFIKLLFNLSSRFIIIERTALSALRAPTARAIFKRIISFFYFVWEGFKVTAIL